MSFAPSRFDMPAPTSHNRHEELAPPKRDLATHTAGLMCSRHEPAPSTPTLRTTTNNTEHISKQHIIQGGLSHPTRPKYQSPKPSVKPQNSDIHPPDPPAPAPPTQSALAVQRPGRNTSHDSRHWQHAPTENNHPQKAL